MGLFVCMKCLRYNGKNRILGQDEPESTLYKAQRLVMKVKKRKRKSEKKNKKRDTKREKELQV